MEAFLAQHGEMSMFLRSNLAAHGLGASDHPHASDFWLQENEQGAVQAVLGCTREGNLMAQAPAAGPALWAAFAQVLQGRRVIAMTGEATQVEAALAGLGLAGARFVTNHAEPFYRMRLADLRAVDAEARKPTTSEIPLLTEWFAAYLTDIGFAETRARAVAEAAPRAARAVQEGRTWLLIEGGMPVAMAGINAEAAGMVQLGGVYVPEFARNRGLGRKVTAALLAAVRREGAKVAVLSANNLAAARSYERIGFGEIGRQRIAILAEPQSVGVPA